MHPTIEHNLMQARQHDTLRSAARQRLAAQARTARRERHDCTAAAPRRGARRLVWRLLPS